MARPNPLAMLARHHTIILLVGALLLVQIITSTAGGNILSRIVTVMFIHVVLVAALQMFMGNSGVVSFAHVGFMGIGAYTSIIFTLDPQLKRVVLPNLYPFLEGASLPFLPALIVGALIAALVAAVIGFPLMRLSGSASVIATFALLVIIHVILLNWNEITNGPRTVFRIERYTDAWTAAIWAIIAVVLAYLFRESRLGLMLRASREDEKAASSVGIDIVMMRWIAFTISAFFAGVAGVLYAHFIQSFGAGAYYLELTFVVLAMLVVGGTGSVSGAVIGVLAITLLSEGVRNVENQINIANLIPGGIAGATEVVVSIVMVLVLILRPSGLTGGRELRLPFGGRAQADAESRLEPAEQDA